MGLCWSEPPVQRVYAYPPPAYPPSQMDPAKPIPQGFQLPPPAYLYQQHQVPQQVYYAQQPYYPQQQNRTTAAEGFLGGLIVASVIDDIMD